LAVKQLDQAKIPVSEFRIESATLDVTQRIKLRKLIQSAGIRCNSGEEAQAAGAFLAGLTDLAGRAGGDAPMPARPSTVHLDNLRGLAGNEQLTAILAQHDTLARQSTDWSASAVLASKRRPAWDTLGKLLSHAGALPDVAELQKQADAMRDERRLLDATDPLPPIHKAVAGLLRTSLNKAHSDFAAVYKQEMACLEAGDNWKKLTAQQRRSILDAEGIDGVPALSVGDDGALLGTLEQSPLPIWKTRTSALPQQFASAALAAARLLEPKTQRVHLSSATLKTEQDVKTWLAAMEKDLVAKIKEGPIVIS
jgi:hypothetical protein